jgi:hypothetical protein
MPDKGSSRLPVFSVTQRAAMQGIPSVVDLDAPTTSTKTYLFLSSPVRDTAVFITVFKSASET